MSSGARNWSLLVPVAAGESVLDLTGDGGETTRSLLAAGARVTALCASERSCELLREAGARVERAAGVAVASLPPESYQAIIATPGEVFRRPSRSCLRALAGWLVPGGLLFMGLENPLWTWSLGRWGRRRFLGESPSDRGTGSWCRGTAARLRCSGFGDVRVYGVFPSRYHTRFLVPLGEPEVERYFLNSMVGGASVKARTARALARAAVATGLLDQLIPAYEVVAAKLEAA
jgi:hypothetical protein